MNFILQTDFLTTHGENLLVGALGGTVGGVLTIFLIFFIRGLIFKEKTRMATYQCLTEQNDGQPGESAGQLMHHLGVAHKGNWKYTAAPAGNITTAKSTSMIYGPYTTDMTIPGIYEIRFIFKGSCPKKLRDKPLFQIDCTSATLRDGKIGAEVAIQGINYILGSDLKKENSFKSVIIRSEETKIREYRIIPFNGEHGDGEKPDNLAIGESGEIVDAEFIRVEIWKINKAPTLMGENFKLPFKH